MGDVKGLFLEVGGRVFDCGNGGQGRPKLGPTFCYNELFQDVTRRPAPSRPQRDIRAARAAAFLPPFFAARSLAGHLTGAGAIGRRGGKEHGANRQQDQGRGTPGGQFGRVAVPGGDVVDIERPT